MVAAGRKGRGTELGAVLRVPGVRALIGNDGVAHDELLRVDDARAELAHVVGQGAIDDLAAHHALDPQRGPDSVAGGIGVPIDLVLRDGDVGEVNRGGLGGLVTAVHPYARGALALVAGHGDRGEPGRNDS